MQRRALARPPEPADHDVDGEPGMVDVPLGVRAGLRRHDHGPAARSRARLPATSAAPGISEAGCDRSSRDRARGTGRTYASTRSGSTQLAISTVERRARAGSRSGPRRTRCRSRARQLLEDGPDAGAGVEQRHVQIESHDKRRPHTRDCSQRMWRTDVIGVGRLDPVDSVACDQPRLTFLLPVVPV